MNRIPSFSSLPSSTCPWSSGNGSFPSQRNTLTAGHHRCNTVQGSGPFSLERTQICRKSLCLCVNGPEPLLLTPSQQANPSNATPTKGYSESNQESVQPPCPNSQNCCGAPQRKPCLRREADVVCLRWVSSAGKLDNGLQKTPSPEKRGSLPKATQQGSLLPPQTHTTGQT